MSVFANPKFSDHEAVHFAHDEAAGLRVIIAIHSTRRGPSAGGTRFWTYASEGDAISDALNLSRAMSYKNAMADIPFGGGKAVIMRPEGDFDRKALFAAYGRAVESLGGAYCTAEDVGVSPEDMKTVRTQTRYVAGLDEGEAASGDPSPVTADGVFRGIEAAIAHKLGRDDMSGLKVAVQGLGHVGYNLCERLHRAGTTLWVADINQEVLDRAERELNAQIVDPANIHTVNADVFAPCALGGAVNPDSILDIQAPIIAGAANNQLSDPDMGQELKRKGILYCPDYVINGGGIINVAAELSGHYDPSRVDRKLEGLKSTLTEIFEVADEQDRPTNEIADQMAELRIYGPH